MLRPGVIGDYIVSLLKCKNAGYSQLAQSLNEGCGLPSRMVWEERTRDCSPSRLSTRSVYDEAPAAAVGVRISAVVAAAASFRIRWWIVNNANSNRSDTPILSYKLRR